MRRQVRRAAAMILCMAAILTACGKKEEAIVSVEPEARDLTAETEAGSEEEQQADDRMEEAAGDTQERQAAAPGTVLGEEEQTLLLEGLEETQTVQRVQGSFGYSFAFSAESFAFTPGDTEDLLLPAGAQNPEEALAFLTVSENLEYALEELADELVLGCDQECLVEDLTIGEEEYPAIWITYTEETPQGMRQVDDYLVGFETHVFRIHIVCMEEALEGLYGRLQVVLSTLRFDSIAEG